MKGVKARGAGTGKEVSKLYCSKPYDRRDGRGVTSGDGGWDTKEEGGEKEEIGHRT